VSQIAKLLRAYQQPDEGEPMPWIRPHGTSHARYEYATVDGPISEEARTELGARGFEEWRTTTEGGRVEHHFRRKPTKTLSPVALRKARERLDGGLR
jgi:hypothetical protein